MPAAIDTPEGDEHYSMQWEVKEDTFSVSIRPYHVEDHALALDVMIAWLRQQRYEAN